MASGNRRMRHLIGCFATRCFVGPSKRYKIFGSQGGSLANNLVSYCFVDLGMNRLILVGNGFDLAHGLKTDYNSFICWYLKKSLTEANNNPVQYEDDLILVKNRFPNYSFGIGDHINSISDLIEYFYAKEFHPLLGNAEKLNIYTGLLHPNPFQITIKSDFFRQLISNCSHLNWVDIENEFYYRLKKCYGNDQPSISKINELNNSLRFIIIQLEAYLSTISCENYNTDYLHILKSGIKMDEIIRNIAEKRTFNLVSDQSPRNTLILNFNYTTTIEKYLKQDGIVSPSAKPIKVNYIHGIINSNHNQIIFGFGDELDEDYKKLELSKINEFFEYIKSFWYFKTSNYHDLVRFIESDSYQIYILGHSCGLSDRTMLNMLFEHNNCKSIKIYYHGDTLKNNYTRLTQDISRHFKDKVAMRRKIVPFDKSHPMPQIEYMQKQPLNT